MTIIDELSIWPGRAVYGMLFVLISDGDDFGRRSEVEDVSEGSGLTWVLRGEPRDGLLPRELQKNWLSIKKDRIARKFRNILSGTLD